MKQTASNEPANQRLLPINVQEEKEKFFFDEQYNPQFEYDDDIALESLSVHGKVSSGYLSIAEQILEQVTKKWKTETEYLEEVEGKILSKEAATKNIQEYLKINNLTHRVRVIYTYHSIPRTSIKNRTTIVVRLPIDYREQSILGMLNHEIGTHVLRWLNEEKQPWYKQRKQYNLGRFLETEEGLAVLHQYLALPHKYLRMEAVRYLSTYKASKMSFSQLYKEMENYIDNRERRWNMCLRAKRGIRDTSIPGCFTKDQLYLQGSLKVLQWLRTHEYNITELYFGKISIDDVAKAAALNPEYKPQLPAFFVENRKKYQEMIEEVWHTNNLGTLLKVK